jgi:hypothetical protein
MPVSRMSPEELEKLFGAGVITLGPKRRNEREKYPPGSLLTPEQDAQLGELIREQGGLPMLELVSSEPPAPTGMQKFRELITPRFLSRWRSLEEED